MWSVTSSTTPSTAPPTTVFQGTVLTDPHVTRLVGSHNDGSDFYGIALGLVAILVAIAVTRLVFRGRGPSRGVEGMR
jgi:hypothetical protein